MQISLEEIKSHTIWKQMVILLGFLFFFIISHYFNVQLKKFKYESTILRFKMPLLLSFGMILNEDKGLV